MATSLPPISLRNGTRIEDPLGTALEFIRIDHSYRRYDLAPVAQDNSLTEADIRVANSMVARMSPAVIAGIYARADVINSALAKIPSGATLAAPEADIPWGALEELMRAMQGIPEVKLARQTKVLHKKRPALIPILDSILATYLRRVDRLRPTSDTAADTVALIRSYKRELDATLPELRALQQELRRRDVDLTECRLLDLFLWGYSGTYTPLYLREAPQVSESARAANPSPSTRPPGPAGSAESDAGPEVEVFRDDDAGYLAWLAEHPDGFVLNVARPPRANYLILHRASCRTISGRPARGGPWTGPYIKVCSEDKLEIAAWTGRHTGVAPSRCGVCL